MRTQRITFSNKKTPCCSASKYKALQPIYSTKNTIKWGYEAEMTRSSYDNRYFGENKNDTTTRKRKGKQINKEENFAIRPEMLDYAVKQIEKRHGYVEDVSKHGVE